ncbi:hypothetical protein [Deinococcus humi]|uniref:Uncharacterized protein n=1 Tax=Deinococcus humi TaxID=662880 RepID=A0A7W8K021_9DEIO|nr:hypothetical protein [Deinococcus humi]MBB5366365.1 hypothetical protein [Deinococcus humi]GGO41466.1 hypothetical protein GCM10008949_52330 [Deinococcus humi]
MTAARHLSVRNRLGAWRRHYPDLTFWKAWHLATLAHGGMGQPQPPVSVMADLYHPARPRINLASTLLLTFEKRTLLGRLPSETRLDRSVPRSLLDACATVPPGELGAYWGDLDRHVAKHLTPAEQPHLNAVARAIRAELRDRGADVEQLPDFFPAAVTDVASYAALARAVLFLAVLPNTPLSFRLYCAQNSKYQPYDALTLNVDASERFLHSHGETGEREVMLGLQLAVADPVTLEGTRLLIPVLNTEVSFGTLYAPSTPLSARLREAGRSATLYLQ